MSYYVVKPPARGSTAKIFLIAAAVVVALLAVTAGFVALRPVSVEVDGAPRLVTAGTTIGDLRKSELVRAKPGDLIGLDGKVVVAHGGMRPVVTRNGAIAADSTRLFPGDAVRSMRGRDATESVETTKVPIPFGTTYEGDGPLTQMKTLGAPGFRRVQRGAASGIEVTSTVVAQPSNMVIVRFRPKGKVVALTFDDGPWRGSTDKILDVLAQERVKATFFMLGRQAKRNPGLAQRVAAEGHALGTHTYSHKALAKLSPKAVRREVRRGREAVEAASGASAPLLRPPYGDMDADAWTELRNMEVTAVLWDVDSRDWSKPGIKKIRRNVLSHVRPGSVILFHDGGGDRRQTLEALPGIIKTLRERGYEFVTVQQLQMMEAEKAAHKARAGEKSKKG